MIAKYVQGLHAGAALLANQPILLLDANESAQMSEALCDILEEYGLSANPRTVKWIALLAASGMIYGPRAFVMATAKPKPKPADPTKPAHKPPPPPVNPAEASGVVSPGVSNGSEMIFPTGVPVKFPGEK